MQVTYPLQSLGAGSTTALALEQFSGMVLGNFEMLSKVWPFVQKRYIQSGNSVQFPAIADLGTSEHTPGEELEGGNEPFSEERTVPIDSRELVAHCWIPRTQEFLSHFDVRQAYAVRAAKAIARTIDSRALRMIALGARQAARGNDAFPSGCRVRRGGGETIAIYTADAAGSLLLESDLAELGQQMDDRNISRDMRIAFVPPYLERVASFNANATSRDYTDLNPNARTKFRVRTLGGFDLIPTTQMSFPTSAIVTGESAYQGNFSKTAVLAIGDPMAIGAALFGGIDPFGPEWHTKNRATLVGAAYFGGIKWTVPEACGEIYTSASSWP